MTVPDYQTLMLPVLMTVHDREECNRNEIIDHLADQFSLSENDKAQLALKTRKPLFNLRAGWAIAELARAGLLARKKAGLLKITDLGRKVLSEQSDRIDKRFLSRFGKDSTSRDGAVDKESREAELVLETAIAVPDEIMRAAHRQIEITLRDEVLDRIVNRDPRFFETLVLKVLLALGYGGGDPATAETVGGAGDDGIDVVVRQDPLGLDRVYVQAKRYARDRTVGPDTVRALAGSLGIFKASKGLLVTTGTFTRAAREAAEKVANRVVLIDGDELAGLMIRYGVGVRIEETFHVKKVDEDFFLE